MPTPVPRPANWDGVRTRGTRIRRRRRAAHGAVALVSVVAIVAAVLAVAGTLSDGGSGTRRGVVATPPGTLSDRIVIDRGDRVEVISAIDGHVISTVATGIDPNLSGGVSATPDGKAVVYTRTERAPTVRLRARRALAGRRQRARDSRALLEPLDQPGRSVGRLRHQRQLREPGRPLDRRLPGPDEPAQWPELPPVRAGAGRPPRETRTARVVTRLRRTGLLCQRADLGPARPAGPDEPPARKGRQSRERPWRLERRSGDVRAEWSSPRRPHRVAQPDTSVRRRRARRLGPRARDALSRRRSSRFHSPRPERYAPPRDPAGRHAARAGVDRCPQPVPDLLAAVLGDDGLDPCRRARRPKRRLAANPENDHDERRRTERGRPLPGSRAAEPDATGLQRRRQLRARVDHSGRRGRSHPVHRGRHQRFARDRDHDHGRKGNARAATAHARRGRTRRTSSSSWIRSRAQSCGTCTARRSSIGASTSSLSLPVGRRCSRWRPRRAHRRGPTSVTRRCRSHSSSPKTCRRPRGRAGHWPRVATRSSARTVAGSRTRRPHVAATRRHSRCGMSCRAPSGSGPCRDRPRQRREIISTKL